MADEPDGVATVTYARLVDREISLLASSIHVSADAVQIHLTIS